MPEAVSALTPALPVDASVLLGFDYGEKRIGVAIGNSLTGRARALGIIDNRSRQYRFDEIAQLIAAWQPGHLVVGLPCHPDGAPHEMTQLARRFGNQLNGRFNLPVSWVDERYSSVDARQQRLEHDQPDGMGGREGRGGRSPFAKGTSSAKTPKGAKRTAIDDEAARVILQQYLDDPFHV